MHQNALTCVREKTYPFSGKKSLIPVGGRKSRESGCCWPGSGGCWVDAHLAPRPSRVRAAAAAGGLRLTWLLTAARFHFRCRRLRLPPTFCRLRYRPLMVGMGRNLISKNTEGIWTKLEPEVSQGVSRLSSSSKNFRNLT